MMVLFILCLLPALLATAGAKTLKCDVCVGQTEACDLAQGTCEEDKATGSCLAVTEVTLLNGIQSEFFRKQCLSSYKNDIKDSFSFTVGDDQYLRVKITKCNNADKCNKDMPEVPNNTTLNRLQCPTCFALNFAACNSRVMPCRGEETHCMDFTGFLSKGLINSPFQAKGCATESTKEIKSGSTLTTTANTYDFYWVQSVPAQPVGLCIPDGSPTDISGYPCGASPALGKFSFPFYLPGLTGLLLVKLLS
ncbi:phospholipase A2 inhibitor and Ly6/PLAUR domain-containing protein-like [Carettochelys insculpta]|uniref:phospholipase A2 inhibitor and Ly6/PLAUR domain-containing protein-like n=1 Tax=Carettochelys insculpta TaxID=44489 RepID=UPI003EBE8699